MATNHNSTRNPMIGPSTEDTNLNVARALRFLALVEPPKGDSLNDDEEFGRHLLMQCCADALESFIDEPSVEPEPQAREPEPEPDVEKDIIDRLLGATCDLGCCFDTVHRLTAMANNLDPEDVNERGALLWSAHTLASLGSEAANRIEQREIAARRTN